MNQQKFPWILFLLSIIFVSLITGISVYFYQQKKINSLTLPIPETVATITHTPTAEPTPNDPRIALSARQWYEKYFQQLSQQKVDCDSFYETRFSANPNTFVSYSSSTGKYSIQLPYNYSWGDSENKVPLYENNDNQGIYFGQPFPSEGCGYVRFILKELPVSTQEKTIQEIKYKNSLVTEADMIPIDPTVTYEIVAGLKYPVLITDQIDAMYGSMQELLVFLPTTTLHIYDRSPTLTKRLDYKTLINSIKILP